MERQQLCAKVDLSNSGEEVEEFFTQVLATGARYYNVVRVL